jgi:GNAT superfamily N-acetyltransferase
LSLYTEDGTVAAFFPAADVLALNRVVGLGIQTRASEAQLDRIIHAAKSSGVQRLFVQLTPNAKPAKLADWIEWRGGVAHNRWARLWRDPNQALEIPKTSLNIVEIDVAQAVAFARIVRAAFGMPEIVDPWIASVVGKEGWRHFAAVHDGQPVATGALFVADEVAWLGFAATEPELRGHGAQSALIATRLRAAAAMGCQICVTETMEELPERPVQSYRNMLRLGFNEAYRRQNYVITLV